MSLLKYLELKRFYDFISAFWIWNKIERWTMIFSSTYFLIKQRIFADLLSCKTSLLWNGILYKVLQYNICLKTESNVIVDGKEKFCCKNIKKEVIVIVEKKWEIKIKKILMKFEEFKKNVLFCWNIKDFLHYLCILSISIKFTSKNKLIRGHANIT